MPSASENPFIFSMWMFNVAAECVLAVYVSRAFRSFPVFSIYVYSLLGRSLPLAAISLFGTHRQYFLVYWIGQALHRGILFLVAAEIFGITLRPFTRAAKWFGYAISAFLSISVASIAVFHILFPAHHYLRLMVYLRTLDQGFNLVLLAAFGAMALFSSVFMIRWRSRAFGIAIGNLFLLVTESATAISKAKWAPSARSLWAVEMAACAIALCVWIWHFYQPDTPQWKLSKDELDEITSYVESATEARR